MNMGTPLNKLVAMDERSIRNQLENLLGKPEFKNRLTLPFMSPGQGKLFNDALLAEARRHWPKNSCMIQENLQQSINYDQRLELIKEAALHGLMNVEAAALREYVASQIEMAYIAGANRLRLTSQRHTKDLVDHGPTLVDARNYVKDKGYKL